MFKPRRTARLYPANPSGLATVSKAFSVHAFGT